MRTQKQKDARKSLFRLLSALGLRAVTPLTLTMDDLIDAFNASTANFGVPDELLMSSDTLDAYRKTFNSTSQKKKSTKEP
jgi:hypothetical protein